MYCVVCRTTFYNSLEYTHVAFTNIVTFVNVSRVSFFIKTKTVILIYPSKAMNESKLKRNLLKRRRHCETVI